MQHAGADRWRRPAGHLPAEGAGEARRLARRSRRHGAVVFPALLAETILEFLNRALAASNGRRALPLRSPLPSPRRWWLFAGCSSHGPKPSLVGPPLPKSRPVPGPWFSQTASSILRRNGGRLPSATLASPAARVAQTRIAMVRWPTPAALDRWFSPVSLRVVHHRAQSPAAQPELRPAERTRFAGCHHRVWRRPGNRTVSPCRSCPSDSTRYTSRRRERLFKQRRWRGRGRTPQKTAADILRGVQDPADRPLLDPTDAASSAFLSRRWAPARRGANSFRTWTTRQARRRWLRQRRPAQANDGAGNGSVPAPSDILAMADANSSAPALGRYAGLETECALDAAVHHAGRDADESAYNGGSPCAAPRRPRRQRRRRPRLPTRSNAAGAQGVVFAGDLSALRDRGRRAPLRRRYRGRLFFGMVRRQPTGAE